MNAELNTLIAGTITELERLDKCYDAYVLEDNDDTIIFGIRVAVTVIKESAQYYEEEDKKLAEELIAKADAFLLKWEDENQ